MEKMDQTRTDCNLTRMGFPGETPLFSVISFPFSWFFLGSIYARKSVIDFLSVGCSVREPSIRMWTISSVKSSGCHTQAGLHTAFGIDYSPINASR